MPITLYHGPAGAAKSKRLWRLLSENHFSRDAEDDFLILTADAGFVRRHKTDYLAHTARPLIGTRVLTFDEFLLRLVKLKYHRVHLADENLSLFLIFLLLQQKKRSHHDVRQIYGFFQNLKTCGLNPEQARRKVGAHLNEPALLSLFEDYQNELHERHHFDPADLYLSVLEALRDKTQPWTDKLRHLYVSRIYPLHAGHREIFRLLQERFPQIHIHIFYDEDHTRPDDLLSAAYEDLGAMSEHNEYIAGEPSEPPEFVTCKTAFDEIIFVTQQIQTLLQNGTAPHDICIAAPPAYVNVLAQLLQKASAPLLLAESFRVQDFISTTQPELASLITLNRNSNLAANLKLQALAAVQRFREHKDFLKSLFQNLNARIDPQTIETFFDTLAANLRFAPRHNTQGMTLTTIKAALSSSCRHVFLLGAVSENISYKQESSLYSPQIYAHKEFAELLNLPQYQYKIARERLNHLVLTAPQLLITAPLTDFSHKPTTALDWKDTHFKHSRFTESKTATLAREKSAFPQKIKTNFSASQIQKYTDCPYQYYATYVLDLERPETEAIEPEGMSRGNFAHLIFQKIVTDHRELYQQALEDTQQQEVLFGKIAELIKIESKDFDEFKDFDAEFVTYHTQRLFTAIKSLITTEVKLRQEEKKSSLPELAEKDFTLRLQNDVTLSGRIDRIDFDKIGNTFSVIDYKTGDSPENKKIHEGFALQLPLYLMAAESLFTSSSPGAALYYNLKEGKIHGFSLSDCGDAKTAQPKYRLTETAWDELKNKTLTNINAAVTGIQTGEFSPKPLDEKLCQYCDFKRVCGYKAKSPDEGAEV